MTAAMENKESLTAELESAQPAEALEAPAEIPAEAPAEAASAPADDNALPMDEPSPEAEERRDENDIRPSDVSEDGSPHGPLDLFGDEDESGEEEKKNIPTFAAFHSADDRKPGELDDDEADYTPVVKKQEEDLEDDAYYDCHCPGL